MSLDMIWGFLNPETRARILEQEKQARIRACKNAVPWDEMKTKFEKLLAIDGKTFDTSRYKLFDSPPLDNKQWKKRSEILKTPNLVVSPEGNFAYANRILPAHMGLDLAQGHKRGEVTFSTDVITPVLFRVTNSTAEPLKVWMGITPFEVMTQRQGVRLAKGDVLIGGLGLGWLLWKVAEKKSVKKVTVVEISEELLQWYGYDLCNRVQEETGTEIEVICDDVLKHMNQHGEDTRHLIDIWPDYPNYVHYLHPREWREVIKNTKHFWGWGVLSDPDDYR